MDNFAKSRLAKIVVEACSEYLRKPKYRKEFEKWYLKTYGHKYEWKK